MDGETTVTVEGSTGDALAATEAAQAAVVAEASAETAKQAADQLVSQVAVTAAARVDSAIEEVTEELEELEDDLSWLREHVKSQSELNPLLMERLSNLENQHREIMTRLEKLLTPPLQPAEAVTETVNPESVVVESPVAETKTQRRVRLI